MVTFELLAFLKFLELCKCAFTARKLFKMKFVNVFRVGFYFKVTPTASCQTKTLRPSIAFFNLITTRNLSAIIIYIEANN